MSSSSFQSLVQAVVASSEAASWEVARSEWEVAYLEEDPRGRGICVCGQTGLVNLFTISNSFNGERLFPIGSHCVNQFGRSDLNQSVSVLSDLIKLRTAFHRGKTPPLDAEYFSRAMLQDLFDNGAFPATSWNQGDGRNDLNFLLQMFNKHDKSSITQRQKSKIWSLTARSIAPHVLNDPRLP